MAGSVKKIIAETFFYLADALETGHIANYPKLALIGPGSEHREDNVIEGALLAKSRGANLIYIGSKKAPGIASILVADEKEAHKRMEELLNSGEVDGAVTMHYPFPVGVATVGRVPSPARGKAIYLATTTGTASTDRVEAMVKSAVAGIITAKACGITDPSVGILNLDGARQCETLLKKLQQEGYPFRFAASARSDGGAVLRGNDILTGSADVFVMDSLTGNLLVKVLSSYSTGGSYEALGDGYGPGIGDGYAPLVLIVSRASGAPVIANALLYGRDLVLGNYKAIKEREYALANKAGLRRLLEERKATLQVTQAAKTVVPPQKETVTTPITGIDVIEIEEAVTSLWQAGIYAEAGMGCTGPIILVNEENWKTASQQLKKNGFIGE